MELNLINIKISVLRERLIVENITIRHGVKPEIRDKTYQHFKMDKHFSQHPFTEENKENHKTELLWDISKAILFNSNKNLSKDFVELTGLYGKDKTINTNMIIFAEDIIHEKEAFHKIIYEAWVKYEE